MGDPASAISSIPDKRLIEGWRCPFPGHPEYLLCLGGRGWDLWHVPGAVAPHLPQCPWPFPFFCPQCFRGAQSCGLIAASRGTVAGPQYAHPAGDSLPLLALPDRGPCERPADCPSRGPGTWQAPSAGWGRRLAGRGAARESKRQVRTSPAQQPGDSLKNRRLLGSHQTCPGWNLNLSLRLAFLSTSPLGFSPLGPAEVSRFITTTGCAGGRCSAHPQLSLLHTSVSGTASNKGQSHGTGAEQKEEPEWS